MLPKTLEMSTGRSSATVVVMAHPDRCRTGVGSSLPVRAGRRKHSVTGRGGLTEPRPFFLAVAVDAIHDGRANRMTSMTVNLLPNSRPQVNHLFC